MTGANKNNSAETSRFQNESGSLQEKTVYAESEQQIMNPDSGIEGVRGPEIQQEQSGDPLIRKISSIKQAADSSIDIRTKAVQDMLGSLEIKSSEDQEMHVEKKVIDPEESIGKAEDELDRLKNPNIDDISKAFIISGLGIRDVQLWLAQNQNEVRSLVSSRKKMEEQSYELSVRLSEEEDRNFLVKIVRGKERRALEDQLRDFSQQITQIEEVLEERRARGRQTESAVREILGRRQELVVGATEQLFQEVLRENNKIKDSLISPETKQKLNDDLIAQRIMPELEKLQAGGAITKRDVDEYLRLLMDRLAEGDQASWNDPIEKKEAIKARIKKLDELNRKSGNELKDLGLLVSSEGNQPANSHYDQIFDFLIREATRDRIEGLCDMLCNSLNPNLRARIEKMAKGIIDPYLNWRSSGYSKEEVLDLGKLHIDDFKQLDGLERWQIVKNFAESSGAISKEIFSQVERIIIQKLFDEQLFPGGRESWEGTAAAKKMGDLGNPEALPLMLRHIEASGSGHTNNAVVYAMERLLKESNPTELQHVLESLPRNKRLLMKALVDENSYMSRFGIASHYTCHLLQNGERTIKQERYAKLLEESGISGEQLGDFYLLSGDRGKLLEIIKKVADLAGEDKKAVILDYFRELTSFIGPDYPDSLRIVDDLAKDLEMPKSDLLARCVDRFESPSKNKTLKKIASPEDGDYGSFPVSLARDGLGLEDKFLEILYKIYKTKTLQSSALEREFYLEGLIMLKGRENGKVALETLLSAYKGTKDDPRRIRRVFQLLSTLDYFGEYDFVTPDQIKVDGVRQEIADLQNQYSRTQDKVERKKIKNKIETLNMDLQNLTGLKGIEDAMTQRVVEAACRRLDLPQEYRNKIEINLEELLRGGVFEIIPSLAGKYEGINEAEVKDLLRTITTHIIEEDFKSWRYTHERSEEQLTGLTEEQKEFWRGELEPVTIDIELPEDEKDRRADELKAAQEIIKNAKEHILDSQPNFDFSKERAQALISKIRELTEGIKSATSEDEKRRLALEKRAVQAEANLVVGILEIENANPQSFTRERILAQARELRERISALDLPLAGLDIEQIEKIFTVGDIKRITAYESDDALTLLKVGVEPQETCQSWRNGGFNECLLAYVADSNKKVLNVADGEGRVVARSIIKLTKQRDAKDFESKTQQRTLLVEKPYSLLPNPEVYRAFMRVLLEKARGIDSSVTFRDGFDVETLKVFEEEARAFGYEMNRSNLELFIPHSLNKYEYSDALGGKISWFDRYQQIEAVTFERSKA